MSRCIFFAALLLPLTGFAGNSANYSLAPECVDFGGLHGTSASYSVNSSFMPGNAGSSISYIARTGFAGQLYDAFSLRITAVPATVNEGGTRQLAVARISDDGGSIEPLLPSEITWSVQSGPLANISAGGLVTAAAVYEDTAATAKGIYQGLTGLLNLAVLETIRDNFGAYAADGLEDKWQVQYFGLPPNSAAAPAANPDKDSYNNLLEFAFGTDPTSGASGRVAYSGAVITSHGQPFLNLTDAFYGRRRDYLAAGLTYTGQFSADLATWESSTTPPTVVASDSESEVASIPIPLLLNSGKKPQFFRLQISTP